MTLAELEKKLRRKKIQEKNEENQLLLPLENDNSSIKKLTAEENFA